MRCQVSHALATASESTVRSVFFPPCKHVLANLPCHAFSAREFMQHVLKSCFLFGVICRVFCSVLFSSAILPNSNLQGPNIQDPNQKPHPTRPKPTHTPPHPTRPYACHVLCPLTLLIPPPSRPPPASYASRHPTPSSILRVDIRCYSFIPDHEYVCPSSSALRLILCSTFAGLFLTLDSNIQLLFSNNYLPTSYGCYYYSCLTAIFTTATTAVLQAVLRAVLQAVLRAIQQLWETAVPGLYKQAVL